MPQQECWGVLATGECQIKAERATSHFDMGSGLIYDVLPPTLDGFYQLTQKGGGFALAWGQGGDLSLPDPLRRRRRRPLSYGRSG